MTQETYRFAYEEAHAELREILSQFELLQSRKEQMEQVVAALKVVMSGEGLAVSSAAMPEHAPFLVHQSVELSPAQQPEAAAEPSPEAEPAYAESSDPFQRRIDMALRHGLGTRDSKVMPRGLSGLLSRA